MTPLEIFTEFLEAVKMDLVNDLDQNDRNATGRTRASIQLRDVTDAGGKLVGAEHVYYTFFGRGPGKMPPLFQIVEWCNARGIPRSAAYPIAKKIKEYGTKLWREGAARDNAITRATSSERIKELMDKLVKSYVDQMRFFVRERMAA